MDTTSTLRSAVEYLASACDHAQQKDNAGFNKFDSRFGHGLAETTIWTPGQTRAAWQMIRKYSGQLASVGIDYSAIPEPPAAPVPAVTASRTISLSQDGKSFLVAFAYNAGLVDTLKATFTTGERRFDGAAKRWIVAARAGIVEKLYNFAEKWNFDVSRSTAEKMAELVGTAERLVEASRAAEASPDFSVSELGGTLRPFQAAGVAYALEAKRCFIADEPGLGKTIQALATIQAASAYPAVVVCPASLKLNWAREAGKWTPGRSIAIWNGKAELNKSADIVIINYDVLKKNLDALKALKPQAVVFDESHYAKNFRAARTEAAKELAQGVPMRLALTGTPVVNRPQELLSQLGIIGRLDDLGGFWNFAKRYCNAHQTRWGWDFSGAQNLDELNTKLRASCLRYGTMVKCEHGDISIGEIVEKKLPIRVWTRNKNGKLELKRAITFSKRIHRGEMVKVSAGNRHFYCTPDHRIWTTRGYIRADTLVCGDNLLALWEPNTEALAWNSNNFEVLQSPMCWASQIAESRCHRESNGYALQSARFRYYDNLRMVWRDQELSQYENQSSASFLQSIMLKQLETDTSSCTNYIGETATERANLERISGRESQYTRSSQKAGSITTGNESTAGTDRSDAENIESQTICAQSSRQNFSVCQTASLRTGLSRGMAGISIDGRKGYGDVSERESLLSLFGYCSYSEQNRNRNRWGYASVAKTDTAGFLERISLERIGVDGIEICESRCRNQPGRYSNASEYVYDIEVEGNHNFFANGILVSNCYIRRNKADVLKELPAKTRTMLPIALSNRREYDRAEKDLISYVRKAAAEDAEFLASIADLSESEQAIAKQTRSNEAEGKARQAEQLVRIEALKQLSANGKIEAIGEWVESFLETGQKLVLFAHHIDIVERLATQFNAPSITGSTPLDKRQEYVDRFQNDPNCKLIVLNIRAGGVGLTLTAASNVAFVELDWTPAAHDQATDRCHRIGQTDAVNAWYLLAERSIDQEIYDLIEEKRVVVTAATEGGESQESGILSELIGRLTKRAAE